MKIDAYTRVMLAVIAAALAILVVRSFQNPPSVSAQQVRPQHVIVDDLAPSLISRLQVLPGTPSLQHVVIDDLGPQFALRGIPVSQSALVSSLQGTWQYSVDSCSQTVLDNKGVLGWELVAPILAPTRNFTYDAKAGRGQLLNQIPEGETVDKYGVCYFKKPLVK